MAELKEVLASKVPKDIQAMPEYKIFLKLIKEARVKTAEAAKILVDEEISACREWIKANKKQCCSGTMTRWLRSKTKKLDFLELIRKKILKYL